MGSRVRAPLHMSGETSTTLVFDCFVAVCDVNGRYIETSAKTGENVDVLFSKLINNVREIKQVAVEEVRIVGVHPR